MSKNHELDALKSREQEAFQRKQAAWREYADARDRANYAFDAMKSAGQERNDARETMNHEYDAMQAASNHYREVWDEYGRIRDRNNSQIDSLRGEADYEHQEMKRCYDQASFEYNYGDKSMASIYSQEGKSHKERRDELNAAISGLVQEIHSAKENAQWRAPKTDSSAFHRAKEAYDYAKRRHESAQAEFKRVAAERDRLKKAFDDAQEEHARLKEEFRDKVDEVRAERQNRDQKMVEKVNMALVKTKPFYLGTIFGHKAKIVPRDNGSGKIDVYFAGLMAAGDGLGHGHAVIDRDGNVTYLRDAWSDHDDYLINDRPPKGKPTHK